MPLMLTRRPSEPLTAAFHGVYDGGSFVPGSPILVVVNAVAESVGRIP